ncbi:MAG: choice-of-anchor D domain-containing protein [Terracidiphilus sp.]
MKLHFVRVSECIVSVCFAAFTLHAQIQSPYQPIDSFNNTSACAALGNNSSKCYQEFEGMQDSGQSDYTFNPTPQNISTVPISRLLPQGTATWAFTEYQPWFCQGTSGCSTGSHVNVGYSEMDAQTYEAQIADMEQRGYQGTIIDYYGSAIPSIQQITEGVANSLKTASCPGCFNNRFYFAILYDPGALSNNSACTGSNPSQSSCEAAALSDIQQIYSLFIDGNPAYLRMASGKVNSSGQPVLLNFSDFSNSVFWQNSTGSIVITNQQIIDDAQSAWGGSPQYIVENAIVGTNSSYAGQYAWVGHYTDYSNCDASDPLGLCNLEAFYDYSVGYYSGTNYYAEGLDIIGAGWKGFDNSQGFGGNCLGSTTNLAPCAAKTISQQCGQTWVQSIGQITVHNDFTNSSPLHLFQVATWNDYDEGTEIETGIDDCLTTKGGTGITSLNLSGGNFTWDLGYGTQPAIADPPSNYPWSATVGSTATLDHFALWANQGNSWTQMSDPTSGFANASNCSSQGNGSYSCSGAAPVSNLSPGSYTLYVQTVGVNSVWNHLSSSGIAYSAEPAPQYSPTSVVFPSTQVGSTSQQTITVANASSATAILSIQSSGVILTSNPSGVFSVNYGGCSGASPGQSCPSITVSFQPNACTEFNGTLQITDNATSNAVQTISLQGTGTNGGSCTSPSTLTPSTYSFGSVSIGSSGSEQFTFTNETGSTFTPAFSYSATSGPAADFSITPGSNCTNLANGSSCSVTLKFSPSQAVSYSGVLNAKNGSTTLASASISGSGYSNNGNKTVLYSQIQLMNGWVSCTVASNACAGGNGGAVANFQFNQSSPDEANVLDPNQTVNSTDFGLSTGTSSGYSNVKYEIQLGAEDQVSEFELDTDVYIDNPSAPEALVFTLAKAIDNNFYPFQFECDLKGRGTWNVWDTANSGWENTGIVCTASQFPANQWVHLVFQMSTAGNTVNYLGVGVGSAQALSSEFSGYPPASQSPDSLDAILVLDGNNTETPFNMWVDNMIAYDLAPAPNASISPATLDLGTVNGSSAQQFFTVTNNGQAAYNISSVSVGNSANFTLNNQCPSSLAPSSSCQIGLTYNNTSTYGTLTTSLTVSGSSTLTANATGTTLNPSTILYSGMQNDSWSVCNTTACAGGDGGATSTWTPDDTTEELNSQESGLAAFSGSPEYSNSRFEDVKGAQDSYSTLQMDMDVYVSDATKPENLIFGMAQALSNNYYAYMFMCDLKGGGWWRIWNLGAGSWVQTSVSCTSQSFTPAGWTHITLVAQRTSSNQMQYLSLAIRAQTYTLNSALYNPNNKTPDDIEGLFFEGGDGSDESYNVYLSNVTISHR